MQAAITRISSLPQLTPAILEDMGETAVIIPEILVSKVTSFHKLYAVQHICILLKEGLEVLVS